MQVEFLVAAIVIAILGSIIIGFSKKSQVRSEVAEARSNRPSNRELTSRVASTIDAFIQQEGGAEFTSDRLHVVINQEFQVSISNGSRVTNALVSVPLRDLNLAVNSILDSPSMRHMAVDMAALYVVQRLDVPSTVAVPQPPDEAPTPSPIFMAELPHPEANTPNHVLKHGNKTVLYYENPKTIGNVSAGIPSIYKYPQCAIIAEGQSPLMIVRVEESDFGSMLCVIEPSGERGNMGAFTKTTRELFLKKVVEFAG
jgi:hypothetical protein